MTKNKLVLTGDPFCLHILSTAITGVCDHAHPTMSLLGFLFYLLWCTCAQCMCVRACACSFTCSEHNTCIHGHIWRPEVDVSYLPSLLSTLFLETWSLTDPGSLQLQPLWLARVALGSPVSVSLEQGFQAAAPAWILCWW